MLPLQLTPLAVHKWPNAGILVDTAAFVAGIRYLVVPGAGPMHGGLAVDDVVLDANDEEEEDARRGQ